MAYQKQTWTNGKTGEPATAERMNHMEDGIANAVETDSVARVTNVVSRNKWIEQNLNTTASSYDKGIYTVADNIPYLKINASQYSVGLNPCKLNIGDIITYSFEIYSPSDFTIDHIYFCTGKNDVIATNYESDSILVNSGTHKLFNTIYVNSQADYVGFVIGASIPVGTKISNIQIEYGTTATEYTPYLNMQELQENRIINFKDTLITGTSDANGFIESSIPEKANILSCKLTSQDGICLPYVHTNGNFSFKCTDWNLNSFATQSLTIYVVYMDN